LAPAVTSFGCDGGWQHRVPPASVLDEDAAAGTDAEYLATASILARFFGDLLAIRRPIVGRSSHRKTIPDENYVQVALTITRLHSGTLGCSDLLTFVVGRLGRSGKQWQDRKFGVR